MRRLIQITFTTMVVTAGITSAAAAQSYVSPDARDSGRHVVVVQQPTDLRSPDTRNPSPAVDLQSPDARDAANNPVATYEPGRAAALQLQQPELQVPSNGFSWGDAGIGAAGMLALIALIGGTLMITTHRRRGPLVTG
jgi:hypothetical protein